MPGCVSQPFGACGLPSPVHHKQLVLPCSNRLARALQGGGAHPTGAVAAASLTPLPCRANATLLPVGVFFVLFPFVAQASIGAGFACLVLVAVSGACAIGPKTAIVHQVTQGPSQVVGMPLYNRCGTAALRVGQRCSMLGCWFDVAEVF